MVVAGKNTSESMKTVKACRHCKALQAGTGDPAAGRFIQADTIIPQQELRPSSIIKDPLE
jgi:hypothetical protein